MRSTKKIKKTQQGQSGPPLKRAYKDLNTDEKAIIRAAIKAKLVTIAELMKVTRRSSSQIRNGLRRSVRAKFLRKVDRGTYRPTAHAVRAVNAAQAKAAR